MQIIRTVFVRALALCLATSVAFAQQPALGRQDDRPQFRQEELDQMLAPIALYPDALLSQVLMAATYPLEVVEAARWSRAYRGIQGDEAVRAAADKDWDPSVKSLLAFPQLLARMDERLDWTRRLGDAFLAQQTQVMDTVQLLRQRAQAAGNLAPDERQRVVADGRSIAIESADPRVVYVPYYDPYVVYGPWWWSAYPPVVWAPWPGYAVVRPGFWWGMGVGVTAGFFFGGMDWQHRHVRVVHVHNHYVRPPYARQPVQAYKAIEPGRWQHNQWHRHGIGQRYEERRIERRGEQRAQSMPPAFRAASPQPQPQPRFEPRQERRFEARPEHRPSPRIDAPQRAQPGVEPRAQVRVEAPRAQPRAEAPQRQVPRMENRGGGGGGWREHAGRNDRRG